MSRHPKPVGPSAPQLLDAIVAAGAVVLHWPQEGGGRPVALILPPITITATTTVDRAPWPGASLARTSLAEWVLAPAALKVHPFLLPALPPRTVRLVMEEGRLASLAGPGYGPCDVGVAAAGEAGAAGAGVLLLRGCPAPALLEAVSGAFPLFAPPDDDGGVCVLPPGRVADSALAALAADHWARLQQFLPPGLADRLAGGDAAATLPGCLWCVLRFPDGDPFPPRAEPTEAAGTVPVPGSTPGAAPVAVALPTRPYYVVPDFLLLRHAAPCLGPRSVEPRWRPAASAAAAAVKALLESCPAAGVADPRPSVTVADTAPTPAKDSFLFQSAATL